MRLLEGELTWFGAALIGIAIFLFAGVGPVLLVARDTVADSTGLGHQWLHDLVAPYATCGIFSANAGGRPLRPHGAVD